MENDSVKYYWCPCGIFVKDGYEEKQEHIWTRRHIQYVTTVMPEINSEN